MASSSPNPFANFTGKSPATPPFVFFALPIFSATNFWEINGFSSNLEFCIFWPTLVGKFSIFSGGYSWEMLGNVVLSCQLIEQQLSPALSVPLFENILHLESHQAEPRVAKLVYLGGTQFKIELFKVRGQILSETLNWFTLVEHSSK